MRLKETLYARLAPWLGRDIRVLDAGCGAYCEIDFGERAHMTGLDVDEAAMRRNEALDEVLVGDLETYPLPATSFDVVICRYVLEHLRDPDAALHNMSLALKPDGWLVLVFPNRWSLKGIVTRVTPHRLHALGYNAFFGKGWASPWETEFAASVSAKGVRAFARREGLRLTLETHPGNFGWLLRKHSPVLGGLWLGAERVAQVLTFGRVSPNRREYIAILERKRTPPEGGASDENSSGGLGIAA